MSNSEADRLAEQIKRLARVFRDSDYRDHDAEVVAFNKEVDTLAALAKQQAPESTAEEKDNASRLHHDNSTLGAGTAALARGGAVVLGHAGLATAALAAVPSDEQLFELGNVHLGISQAENFERNDGRRLVFARACIALAAQSTQKATAPLEAIGQLLANAMNQAVANGANSVSMPDEYVAVAGWLAGVEEQQKIAQTKSVFIGNAYVDFAKTFDGVEYKSVKSGFTQVVDQQQYLVTPPRGLAPARYPNADGTLPPRFTSPALLTGRIHTLKTDPDVFDAVAAGLKTYEIRFNDRDFMEGDTLELRRTKYTAEQMRKRPDICPLEYTGEVERRVVSHILSGYGIISAGWVILSFAPSKAEGEKA